MGRGGGGGGGSFHGGGGHSFSGGSSRSYGGSSRSYGGSSRGSSGFSGGGRSGGSFSGGSGGRGSYSGGSSYRPSSGSSYRPGGIFRPTYAPGVVVVNNNSNNKYGNGGGGGNYNGNNGGGGGGNNNNSGCGGCLKIILIALLVFLVMSLIGTIMMYKNKDDGVRAKLENGKVSTNAGYYLNDNFYEYIDGNELQKGLKDFYDKTGVKPFIFFTSSGELMDEYSNDISTIAREAYDVFIGSENGGHLLLAWYETADDDYYADFWIGSQAQAVMDDAAIGILQRQIVRCYDDTYTYEDYAEFMSAAYSKAADEIMADNSVTAGGLVAEVFMILLVGGALFLLIRKEKKLEQDRINAEILNAPLQSYSDDMASQAAKKYDTPSPAAEYKPEDYYGSPAAKSYADSASNGGYSYKVNSGQTETDDSLKTYADTEAEELAKKYESQD